MFMRAEIGGILPTAAASETTRQSTRVAARIAVTIVSTNPFIEFSESCNTVSVNAQGCAMHSDKPLAVSTPVLLRLQNGKEAGGQVAFCKGSPSNDKLWGLGIVLDKPGNFWGLDPCPKDWVTEDDNAATSPSSRQVDAGGSKTAEPGITAAQIESVRSELREGMRQELASMFADSRAKLNEELQTQKKNTALAEGLLQDAVKARESLTSAVQSLEEELQKKAADGTKNAIERIEASMNALKLEAQTDSEEQLQRIRKETEEIDSRVEKAFSSQSEKAQQQFSEAVEGKKKEIADAASSIGQVSDQIYTTVKGRLENDFESQKEVVASTRNSITAEVSRLQAEVGGIEDRLISLRERSSQQETDFGVRLDERASEAIKQVQVSLEQVLADLRKQQTELARTEMENLLTPISTRADSLIKELGESANLLTRERDEIQLQLVAIKQAKEDAQVWLAQQTPEFQKMVQNVMSDAKAQAKTIMQNALSVFQDPVEKLNREAKSKIDEFMMQQHSELDEGIRRLRNLLATLEQQAEDSLRASFETSQSAPTEADMFSPDKATSEIEENAEKTNARGSNTFAKKLSGLVRGQKA
jgi:hypothetical protein